MSVRLSAAAASRRPRRAGTQMGLPPQITLRGLGPSPALERVIRRKLSWLQRYFPYIMASHVVLEAPHGHHRKGRLYHVRIDLTVPGGELVVAGDPWLHLAHEDVLVAIRDSFDAARRELMDYARLRRRQVKVRAGTQNGRVTRLEVNHGFLESEDGREIYFHRNSVRQRFERLAVGTKVRFTEERGDKGPQASTLDVGGAQRLT